MKKCEDDFWGYIESKTLVFVNHDQDFYCSYGERRAKDDL